MSFILFNKEKEYRQLHTEIICAWAKGRKIESVTDIAELTILYRQKIAEKLEDLGCSTDPDIDLLTLAWLDELVDLAFASDYSTKIFILWLLPKAQAVRDFIFMARTDSEAMGALRCWTYSQDWGDVEAEFLEESVQWEKVLTKIWEP